MKQFYLLLSFLLFAAGLQAQPKIYYSDTLVYKVNSDTPYKTRFGSISDSAAASGAVAMQMGFPVVRSLYRYGSNAFPFETQAQKYPNLEVHVVLNILPLDSTQSYPDSGLSYKKE